LLPPSLFHSRSPLAASDRLVSSATACYRQRPPSCTPYIMTMAAISRPQTAPRSGAFLLLALLVPLLLASRAIAQSSVLPNDYANHLAQAQAQAQAQAPAVPTIEPIVSPAATAGWALQASAAPCPAGTHGGPTSCCPRGTVLLTHTPSDTQAVEVLCCPEGEEQDKCVRAVKARPACADAAWTLRMDQRDGRRFCCGGGEAGGDECPALGAAAVQRRQGMSSQLMVSSAYMVPSAIDYYIPTPTPAFESTITHPYVSDADVLASARSYMAATSMLGSGSASRSSSFQTTTSSSPPTGAAALPTDTPLLTTPAKSSRNRNRTIGIAVAVAGAVVALIGFAWRCHARRRNRRRASIMGFGTDADGADADGADGAKRPLSTRVAELPVVTQQIMDGGQGGAGVGVAPAMGAAPAMGGMGAVGAVRQQQQQGVTGQQGTYTWELVYRPPVVEMPVVEQSPVELPAGSPRFGPVREMEAAAAREDAMRYRG
ncbi:hypothetical protein DFP73DRAFT_611455, partial [Morchella snyderi]